MGINTDHGVHVPERINYFKKPPHHTFKPTASICSLGKLKIDYVEKRRDKELPLECLHFPIYTRFTERFWHLSKYFFVPSDRQNNYLNKLFTKDVSPRRNYQKNVLFYLQFGFLHPTQMDVNNQTHKVNRTKMIHTIHNYLFV